MQFTKKFLSYFFLVSILLIFLFPFYFIISTSFKEEGAVCSGPFDFGRLTLENWRKIFVDRGYASLLAHGFFISMTTTALGLLIGLPAAYSLTKLNVPHAKDILFWIFSLRILPPIVITLPLFIIFSQAKLIDTYHGMIMVHTMITLPLTVWIVRGFLIEIPKEYEEAAMVDGCSRLSAFVRVIIPAIMPGILLAVLFSFVFSWNDYLLTLLLGGRSTATLPVAIAALQTNRVVLWGQFTAGACLSLIPAIMLAVLMRKHLTRGLSFGLVGGK